MYCMTLTFLETARSNVKTLLQDCLALATSASEIFENLEDMSLW